MNISTQELIKELKKRKLGVYPLQLKFQTMNISKPKNPKPKGYLDILKEAHTKGNDNIDDKEYEKIKVSFKAKQKKVGTFI